jgi:multiple sugar transport system substrate-binding protein
MRPRRRTSALVLAGAVAGAAVLSGCGSSSQGSGPPTVNWYIGNESWLTTSGGVTGVVDACNAKAGGAFRLVPQALPTNPDGQREQLVRRLAARDSSIDLIGMDVTWTAEFGQAGWIRPFAAGELTNVGDPSKVIKGPYDSAVYNGVQYGAPLNSNTRLLWYRKSKLGDRPVPQTWDQLLDTAQQLNSKIQETGARAESLDVTFNSLVESAGGHLVTVRPDGTSVVDLPQGPTEKALSIMGRYATSQAAPVGLANAGEDTNRLAFQTGSDSAFMINWPFVWPSVVAADAKAGTHVADDYGWAPFPRVDADKPARAALGGYNLGIGSYTKNPGAALAAINCLTDPAQQRTIAEVGGQPSVLRSLAQDPQIAAKLPMVGLMAQQLETAAPRPVTPNYNDVSLAVRQELHPTASIPTGGAALTAKYRSLRDLIDKALKSQAVL